MQGSGQAPIQSEGMALSTEVRVVWTLTVVAIIATGVYVAYAYGTLPPVLPPSFLPKAIIFIPGILTITLVALLAISATRTPSERICRGLNVEVTPANAARIRSISWAMWGYLGLITALFFLGLTWWFVYGVQTTGSVQKPFPPVFAIVPLMVLGSLFPTAFRNRVRKSVNV